MSPYRATFNVQIPQKNQSIGPYFLPKNKNHIIPRIEKRTYSSPFFAILHEILTCVSLPFIAFIVTKKALAYDAFTLFSVFFDIRVYDCVNILFACLRIRLKTRKNGGIV